MARVRTEKILNCILAEGLEIERSGLKAGGLDVVVAG